MAIPLLDLKAQYLAIEKEIQQAIHEVLESQHFILGPKVEEFEGQIARYCQVKHAIGVASGSDALLLALMAIGIKNDDEVITSPYTFFSTAGSISRLGAKPVFVDIDPKTYNINPAFIQKAITRRTRAIIPVHLFGQCADMDPILKIAKEHQLAVIEDAAQAIGSRYKERQAGSMGDIGTLSFFPSKNLGSFGDGGMVLTNDANVAETIKVLRVHGSKPKYFHSMIGVCSRLDALQAAILLVKLKYLNGWTEKRRDNAKRYDGLFVSLNVVPPYAAPASYHIYNQYIIRVPQRDALRQFLADGKIATEIYYPLPLHLQKCYRELKGRKGDFAESEKASEETLGLPIYPEITSQQQTAIVHRIAQFLNQSKVVSASK